MQICLVSRIHMEKSLREVGARKLRFRGHTPPHAVCPAVSSMFPFCVSSSVQRAPQPLTTLNCTNQDILPRVCLNFCFPMCLFDSDRCLIGLYGMDVKGHTHLCFPYILRFSITKRWSIGLLIESLRTLVLQ